MVTHSTTLNVSSSEQWRLFLQDSTFVKTFIKACGQLSRVRNNFRTQPIHLKSSTNSFQTVQQAPELGSRGVKRTIQRKYWGQDMMSDANLYTAPGQNGNHECRYDFINEITCSYIYRSIKELKTIKI
jgi:hypothetical protein